jgi:hypothetical protein
VERCWYGKVSGGGECPEDGRYGNPEYRPPREDGALSATLKFMRAARWCAAHKHPDDRLLTPGGGEQFPEGGEPSPSGPTR